jgi:hypothetical protein
MKVLTEYFWSVLSSSQAQIVSFRSTIILPSLLSVGFFKRSLSFKFLSVFHFSILRATCCMPGHCGPH